MAWANRGEGPVVATCVQVLPSHSQVSPKGLLSSLPPNSTVRPRWLSKAMAMVVAACWPGGGHLRPGGSVPPPGVAEVVDASAGAPKQHGAPALAVVGHRLPEAG